MIKCDHNERSECKIFNKPIIVDANFAINLINAIGKSINTATDWRQQTTQFNGLLQGYLRKFCKCPSGDKLLTTDLVMNNELDIRNTNSTISRKAHFLSEFRRRFNAGISGPFMLSVWTNLNDSIETISITAEEIASLSALFGGNHHLSNEDLSLIICAAKQTTTEGTLVVTADLNLEDHLMNIVEQGSIQLPTGRFSTNRIVPIEIHTYLDMIHHCCEMSNQENYLFFKHLFDADIDRLRGLTDRVARVKTARLHQCYDVREKTVQYKNARATT